MAENLDELANNVSPDNFKVGHFRCAFKLVVT